MQDPAPSLAYVDTLYSADSIEWCPFEGYQNIFVCGTYQIVKQEEAVDPRSENDKGDEGASESDEEVEAGPSKPTERVGRLLVFRVGEDQVTLNEIQRIETAAILDTKWSPRLSNGRPSLAVADAKGCITMYSLNPEVMKLEEDHRVAVADELTLCLSLDFSHRLHPSSPSPSSIITSLSSGSLAYLKSGEAGYKVESEWKAHDFEPWITSFDIWDLNTVWSGGDDCKLKRWDVRQTFRPTLVNKNFEAGVTTISSSPHTPHLLAVGSYDENLRIFDSRSPLEPLTTIPLGGGIWRTRFHPSIDRKGDILNACMHDNFKIVRLDPSLLSHFDDNDISMSIGGHGDVDAKSGWEIVKQFEAHDSLAYGADWSRLPGRSDSIGAGVDRDCPAEGSLIASCSFYDHAMHLWRG
ncbi:WD40 repeat domain 85 [Kwoniella heveanensis CBS 569]|nr:WD40 repeat domain 85 [Kwoniella heveanensis CBS 569]